MEESVVPEQESGGSGIRESGIGELETRETANLQSPISNLQSSAPTPQRPGASLTVLVGLAMLLVGVLLGYFGRPLVTPRPPESVAAATAPQAEAAASAQNPGAATFMDAIVAQTRHFRGNADAPVTMVEFGDFQ